MKRINLLWLRPRVLFVTALLLVGVFTVTPVWSVSVGSVTVMDPEDVGDQAMIARAKAKKRSEQGLPGQGGGSNSSADGCSDIAIGNVQTTVGGLVPRNIVTVVEGPIIQENKCK